MTPREALTRALAPMGVGMGVVEPLWETYAPEGVAIVIQTRLQRYGFDIVATDAAADGGAG